MYVCRVGGQEADLFDLRSYDASDVPAGYRCVKLEDLTHSLSSLYYAVKIWAAVRERFP